MNIQLKNPEKLEITKVFLNCGKNEKHPALSAYWVEKRELSYYMPLKLKNGKLARDFDETGFVEQAEIFNEDLEWILGLSFHRFWSHVLYDKEFLNPLIHFLQESTPFYLSITHITDNKAIAEIYEKICRNVIVIVCRLVTNRESDEEYMTKEKQAEILYENFILTIPMMFDMLVLYGYSNKGLVQKVVSTVLKIEPKYVEDIKSGIKFIHNSFTVLREQLITIEKENRDLFQKYEDVTMFLMNIAVTLNLLIDLLPNEIKQFCSKELRLEATIANLYDNFISTLYINSFEVNPDAWFLTYIDYARVEFINCFRSLLNRPILAIFNAGEKNRLKFADEILSILSECAGYHSFIEDYIKLYPIEMDLDVITQSGKKVDKIKLEFVRDAFKSNTAASSIANGYHLSSAQEVIDEEDSSSEMEGACALPLKKYGPELPTASENIEDVLQIETSKILELFPNYGVGFIRKLLLFYDNSSETVISKILEGTLDEKFKDCDEQETYIPAETPDKVYAATGIERTNIYDGDKFDVMRIEEFSGDVLKNGKSIIKKGPNSYADLINDKSHINEMRDRYKQYSLLPENESDREYDDEMDDSYEVFADTEPRIHIRGKMREALPDNIDLSESESEDEPEKEQPKRSPLDFCENPEIIRARREQQFRNRMAKKHPNKPIPTAQPSKDVVGNAKGQGQSNEVIRNRQQKSANKSSRANHNRKAGNAFKQSRGMY